MGFWNRLCLVMVFGMVMVLGAFLALPALAQDEGGGGGFLSFLTGGNIMAYLVAGLALIEFAKRVCVIVPGKKDDEIVGIIDGILRKAVDFVAGKTGKASDPSLVKRE